MSNSKLIGFKPTQNPVSSSESAAQSVIMGDRPRVEKITAQIRMTKPVAQQIFPTLVWGENEHDVVVTEVLRSTQPGEVVACVHGASGQKFSVSHYELDGIPL